MSRMRLVVSGVALLVVLSGCAGFSGTQTTQTTTSTTSVTTTATTDRTTAGTITTKSSPPFGTQEVSVSKLENQSKHTEWPENETVQFENLSKPQQTVFRQALENGSVTFGPDETNPFSFNNKSRPEVVKYDGTWYYVRVSIV